MPSTLPAEIVPLASNQFSNNSSCDRSARATFFIGPIRDRITFLHQSPRNRPAQYGERYSQNCWNSSRSRYARTDCRL